METGSDCHGLLIDASRQQKGGVRKSFEVGDNTHRDAFLKLASRVDQKGAYSTPFTYEPGPQSTVYV